MVKAVIVIGVSIALGIICGSGCVYAFNHMPDEWLGADEKGREWQRVKSMPWKYIFTATFIVVGIYLGMKDQETAAGLYAACIMLTEIAMAGFLYGKVPRPVVWLLALTGLGILPFSIDEDLGFGAGSAGMIKSHLAGAVIGFVTLLILMLIKRIVLHSGGRKVIDFALCELGLVLGLLCGPLKVSVIIATGIVLWGGYIISKRFGGAGSLNDKMNAQGKDVMEKRKIGESFFIAASAFFWMVVWPF